MSVISSDLFKAGNRLKKARAEEARARSEVRFLIKKAKRQGLTITYIAATAGVARQTVYNILDNK
jgi:DNA invertase Pin-like site-specific DNA recombinase